MPFTPPVEKLFAKKETCTLFHADEDTKNTHNGRTTRREELGSHLSVLECWIGKTAMETPKFTNDDLFTLG